MNPNCDGSNCTEHQSEVRVLPTGGSSNAILCRSCFEHELRWRRERNKELSDPFDLPEWEDADVYRTD